MKNVTAEHSQIGTNVKIADSAQIICKELIIGNDVHIDERVKIICKNGKVIIGDQTYIGNDTNILLKSFEIGEYCKLHNHSLLNGKESVKIGDNCWLGQNCVLNGESELIIGNNVGIGTYSSVWTHGYFGQLVDGCQFYSVKPTIIEDDVWLVGSYNTIFPGVTIGKQAVLMGTSVVTKSLEAGKVYGGNPAKEITNKVGAPYQPVSFEKKKELILEHLKNYLTQNKINYSDDSLGLSVNDYGNILFTQNDLEKYDHEKEMVIFCDEVKDWSNKRSVSKFCLSSKRYQKNYSSIEILTKKILNPVVARFIKY